MTGRQKAHSQNIGSCQLTKEVYENYFDETLTFYQWASADIHQQNRSHSSASAYIAAIVTWLMYGYEITIHGYKSKKLQSLQQEPPVSHFLTNNQCMLASFIRLAPSHHPQWQARSRNKPTITCLYNSFTTSGNVTPRSLAGGFGQCHIPDWLNPWQHLRENLKPCTFNKPVSACVHVFPRMNTRTHEHEQKQHSPYYSGKLTQPAASRAHSWNKWNVHT